MLYKILFFTCLIFFSCDKKKYSDFNPLEPSICDVVDVTGECCIESDLDCNNICNGNSAINCNNECVSTSYLETCNGCSDENALNFNENSTDDYNCIYDSYPEGYTQLVWNDEFNSPVIDISKWNFEIGGNGWGNNESQHYTDRQENAYIENGNLIIKAIFENYSGSLYTSARMTTQNKGDFLYGRIESRIKLPTGDGTWPAFWMMPTESVYGGWPNSGEIDIMEHVGCDSGTIHGSIHCDQYNHIENTQQTGTYSIQTNTFHEYAIEWNENSISWFIDDVLYFTFNKTNDDYSSWPFDQKFFLILNLAVGGNWGGICSFNGNTFPQEYQIDYIRVFQ